jgi:hypothetical protein
MRDGTPGFRQFFAIGPVHLCRIGSWDTPYYPSFGAWFSGRGLSLRYRGYILRVN